MNVDDRAKRSVDALVRYAKEKKSGQIPDIKEWNHYAKEHGFLQYAMLQKYYNVKFNDIRKRYNLRMKQYSREECVSALKTAAKHLGPKFSRRAYGEWAKGRKVPSAMQLNVEFSTFNKAKQAAGLLLNHTGYEKFSDREVKKWIVNCYKTSGLISWSIYQKFIIDKPDAPSVAVLFYRARHMQNVHKYFKDERGPEKIYTDSELKKYLKRFIRDQLKLEQYKNWSALHKDAPTGQLFFNGERNYDQLLDEALTELIDIKN